MEPISELNKNNSFSHIECSGINNIGNTCYMNSALQMLIKCGILTNFILKRDFTDRSLLIYKRFLKSYIQNQSFSPHEIKRLIAENSKSLVGFRQEDSHDCLMVLMDIIDEGLKREFKDSSKTISIGNTWVKCKNLSDHLFDTHYKSIITSSEDTSDTSEKDETIKILTLEIPDNAENFFDCLDHFQKKETLSKDNRWLSEKYKKKVMAKKKLKIKKTPKYLIVHLKRFEFINPMNTRKITKNIM